MYAADTAMLEFFAAATRTRVIATDLLALFQEQHPSLPLPVLRE